MEFSRIVASWTGMLIEETQKKFELVPFLLTSKAKASLCNPQETFITALFLRHFDRLLPIRMETDASSFAISAILSSTHSKT